MKGYTLSSQVTLATPTVLSVNYYDRYDFIGSNGIPSGAATAYEKVAGYDELRTVGVKGLLTGTLTAKLNSSGAVSGYLYSVMYYDERGRLIQQRGNNSLGGEDKIFTAYDFPGNPTQVRKVHTVGADTRTEVYTYTYDQAERLLRTTYQLDNAAVVTLVDNTYDEVGRLKSDSRNGNAKLKTEYAYNVRSWTKSITGTLFSQTLNYQEAITGNTPCYNGNISSMSWKAGSETSPRGYRFTYDGLSRLKDALYGEGATLAANTDRFNEQVTGYDKMGNILGLKRYGQTAANSYGLIDHLALTYNGNRLQAVKDAATNSVYGNGTEFKDNSNQTVEYTYDKNGNLTKDLNKDISKIGYNLLNLPDEVTFANGNSIRYEYAADGTKLRTVHKTGATTLTTDYCGNAVYENGVLRMLLNEAGYVSFPDRKFHFYLKDHQGNTRVVADKDGNVEETNAYYPFGGTFTSTNSVQPYKYNEELDTRNGLNWYDYGARQYDAAIGRWHAVDPSAEKYYNVNSYAYCNNNPIKNIDIDGRDWYMNESTGNLYFHRDSVGQQLMYNDQIYTRIGNNNMLGDMKNILSQLYNFNESVSLAQANGYSINPIQQLLSEESIEELYSDGKHNFTLTTGKVEIINEKYSIFSASESKIVGVKTTTLWYKKPSMLDNLMTFLIGRKTIGMIERNNYTYSVPSLGDKLMKSASNLYGVLHPMMTGKHDYRETTVYNSWSEYLRIKGTKNKMINYKQ
ncbi:RHS repeat domain-containing protein [Bacteroides bouchesdurhonensis]|uniref:RHS repeat domain-containing protein n=1 Tax=Bacteroides bouchesdurhonensis TaxID=1841855 RepID=UPI0011DDF0C3|nr:RHS repeat-associated core domain-containing protein [Bacteroides bouchesdurhonensis]